MLEMKITIIATELADAINKLASALNGNHKMPASKEAAPVASAHAAQPATPATPVNPTPAPAAPMITPVNTPSAAPATTPTTVATTAPAVPAKSYTVDDLSRAGATLIDLLKKYGVQAVTQLDASQYPAFVEDMKALGAAL